MSMSMSQVSAAVVISMIAFGQVSLADEPMNEWELRQRDACQRTRLMLGIYYEQESPEAISYGNGMRNRMDLAHKAILDRFATRLASHSDTLSSMSSYLNNIREVRLAEDPEDRGFSSRGERSLVSATAPATLIQVNEVVNEVSAEHSLFSLQPVPADFTSLRREREGGFSLAVATIPEVARSSDGQGKFVHDRIYAEVGEGEIRIRACTQARGHAGSTLFDGCTTEAYTVDSYGNLQSSRSELESGLFEVRGFTYPVPEKAEYLRQTESYQCSELLERPTGLASSGQTDRTPAVNTQDDGATAPENASPAPAPARALAAGNAL